MFFSGLIGFSEFSKSHLGKNSNLHNKPLSRGSHSSGDHMQLPLFTARKRSLGQGNIFTSVCQEFYSQGGSAPLHAGIPSPGKADNLAKADPLAMRPPWQGNTPLARQIHRQGDPPAQCMLGDTVNKRAVCILLECNLVSPVCFGYYHTAIPSAHTCNKNTFQVCSDVRASIAATRCQGQWGSRAWTKGPCTVRFNYHKKFQF